MIKFFRKIRQSLLSENKFSRYLIYAIGEIILVVIGILIALQINNWNEKNKSAKWEREILTNLYEDLRADSLQLAKINTSLKTAVIYKRVFENYIDKKPASKDSINNHFHKQYNMLVDYVPNSNTIDEITNGNGLNNISNPNLRRKIVTLYNNYNNLILNLKIGQDKGRLVVNYVSSKVKDINNITDEEIIKLLNDNYYVNQTLMNFLATQLSAVEESIKYCLETLELIKKEISND